MILLYNLKSGLSSLNFKEVSVHHVMYLECSSLHPLASLQCKIRIVWECDYNWLITEWWLLESSCLQIIFIFTHPKIMCCLSTKAQLLRDTWIEFHYWFPSLFVIFVSKLLPSCNSLQYCSWLPQHVILNSVICPS